LESQSYKPTYAENWDALPSKKLPGWWFGTMEFHDFPYIGNVIIPTDFHIFPEGLKPPTSCSIQEYLVITVVA